MPITVAETATPVRRATEDDLRATPRDGRKYELVDGQIIASPAGTRHGLVSGRLAARLLSFVEANDLGYVQGSSTGFRLPGGNVRSPDASFVAKERFASGVPEGVAVAYRSLTDVRELKAADDLVGEDVLPGFRCSLAEILK